MNLLELMGYIASALVAISLTMSSIVRLRWLNLAGGLTFALYGFLIGAYPVAAVNSFTACINIFYLIKIYRAKVEFNVIKSGTESGQSGYISFFLDRYSKDIKHFFPDFDLFKHDERREYYLLTDQETVVGILSGIRLSKDHFQIDLDLVTPTYRDARLGNYLFGDNNHFADKFKIENITANAQSEANRRYLKGIGFKPIKDNVWQYRSS